MSSAEKIAVRTSATQKRGASTTHFNAPSGRFMDIVSRSLDVKASSIHIEPTEVGLVVRCRKDGAMIGMQNYEKKLHLPLIAHIKTIARVQPIESGAEYEGIYVFKHGDATYQLAISTLPTRHGEKVVISVNNTQQSKTLSSLGMWGPTLDEMKKCLSEQRGLLVATGQEKRYLGQTMHSIKALLEKHGIKYTSLIRPTVKSLQLAGISEGVLIIEDANDSKLLHALIEVNASKQLVVLGLSLPSAESVYTFFRSSGAESHLIDHNVNGVLSQREVRVLCSSCRVAHTPEGDEIRRIHRMSGLEKANFNKTIHEFELKAREQFTDTISQDPNTSPDGIERIYSAHEGGCDNCFGTGFDGSMSLFELQKNSLKQRTLDKCMGMAVDGVVKMACGITTIEEVERAVTR